MGDRVFVEGLELYCVIGVHQWERQTKQKVRIEVELETDCRPAGEADDLELALDYRSAAKAVISLVEGSSFKLVETLGESIAADLLARFPVATAVQVRVGKPGAVRWANSVGVEIVRRRDAAAP